MEVNNATTAVASPGAAPKAASSTQAAYIDSDGITLDFDPSISEDERRFYMKAYPSIELVRERKVHCTICKMHIGTSPSQESIIKMHPILRVTHCTKCHDFYNSGEFSKGEDGSELYCRWCGQGGEVYCCSNCPYVFCKSCIVKNLSRGVVADIEQNENWSCFSCAPKILWPLRAQHWALVNYIEKQKKIIQAMNVSESEKKQLLAKDRSTCCRLAKSKCGNMSDSMESLDSATSRRSHGSSSSTKKTHKMPMSSPQTQTPSAKRVKTSNDEVVCTPDLLSMLEPDCQLTMSHKSRPTQSPVATKPKVISIQSNYSHPMQPNNNTPPPLVLRNTGVQLRTPLPSTPIVRRTVIGARTPTPTGNNAPVYHTINGFRIDLNTAAQQETFRLPNGKLIQVKRQGTQQHQSPGNSWSQQQQQQRATVSIQAHPHPNTRPIQITQGATQPSHYVTVQQPTVVPSQTAHHLAQQQPQVMRYHNTTVTPVNNHNGAQIQVINGVPTAPAANVTQTTVRAPIMVRHIFPDTAIGQARSQLQDQVFNAMEICQHLTGKVQTLTNSNAYKQARNYLEVKELYIHLSYLLTYAIGRFKGLQDKCLNDMRQLGFVNDADSLENGQLAAGVDYVRYGQLDDVDLFNTSSSSFHNQVYEYRKSLHANLKDGDGEKPPLSPLMPLGEGSAGRKYDNDDQASDSCWPQDENDERADNEVAQANAAFEDTQEYDDNDEREDNYLDEEPLDDGEGDMDGDAEADAEADTDTYSTSRMAYGYSRRSIEDCMSRGEETIAFDRKLTRLVQQYPSIWCTRHPDYGNFDVTRKQWRTIATHFKRSENIKLRWKNIRKRFVRIERRMREGKRFNGYFDKATNFLANRDLPENEWVPVDCGTGDGDMYERRELDAIERNLHSGEHREQRQRSLWENDEKVDNNDSDYQLQSIKPIEIRAIDYRIINFVKCHPVLWRKSNDATNNKADEQTRRSLWMHLWKSMPNLKCEDVIDRWTHLYEMYKTFRLKTIKDERTLANLELKYSKYLAKLYFLYKIDEEELRNENFMFEDFVDINEHSNQNTKLQDMPDDKEFMVKLVRTVRQYPALWNTRHIDYHDTVLRENLWRDIETELKDFKHKQASDDEDNEIEIVEPKTDTITLDSDNEDEVQSSSPDTNYKPTITQKVVTIKASPTSSVNGTVAASTSAPSVSSSVANPNSTPASNIGDVELMSAAQTLLASLLEVDLTDNDQTTAQASSPAGSSDSTHKKQPRKKTTNKPNPTLLKQKEMMERERLEEMKRNDLKLKMKCAISLTKAEDEYPFAKGMLQEKEVANVKEYKETTENRKEEESRNEEKKDCKEPKESAVTEKPNEPEDTNNTADEENTNEVEILSVIDGDSSMDNKNNVKDDKEKNSITSENDVNEQKQAKVEPTKVDQEKDTAVISKETSLDEKLSKEKKTEDNSVVSEESTAVQSKPVSVTIESKIVESNVESDRIRIDQESKIVACEDAQNTKRLENIERVDAEENENTKEQSEIIKKSTIFNDKAKNVNTDKNINKLVIDEVTGCMEAEDIVAAETSNTKEEHPNTSACVEDTEMKDMANDVITTKGDELISESRIVHKESIEVCHEKCATAKGIVKKVITAVGETPEQASKVSETLTVPVAETANEEEIKNAQLELENDDVEMRSVEPEATAETQDKSNETEDKCDGTTLKTPVSPSGNNLNEPEIDVDKEIEKLLKNKDKSENSINETATGIYMTDTKEVIPEIAPTNADTGTSSPDLLADINELIENENNAMT